MRTFPFAVVVAAAALLTGCSGILPAPAPPPALYRLTAASDFPANPGLANASTGANASPVQLQITAPSAEAALDTTRIALSRSPTSLDYFADAAWSDRLPLVLQARLVDSFANAHRVIAVAGEASAARGDAILTIALRHFEADYGDAGAPRWRIELSADLINAADRKVIATRIFTATADAPHNDVPAIVATADQDWRGVARQIVDWATDNLSRRAIAVPPPPVR
jgi:cholesterol transport system auxiliary component